MLHYSPPLDTRKILNQMASHCLVLTTPWWSINLSDNWAFNAWIVNFIKLHCLFWAVLCIVTDWSIHSHPYTSLYIQSGTLHTFLSHMCVQNLLANQICVLYTTKSCPIVGELPSFPMEGRYQPEILQMCAHKRIMSHPVNYIPQGEG